MVDKDKIVGGEEATPHEFPWQVSLDHHSSHVNVVVNNFVKLNIISVAISYFNIRISFLKKLYLICAIKILDFIESEEIPFRHFQRGRGHFLFPFLLA